MHCFGWCERDMKLLHMQRHPLYAADMHAAADAALTFQAGVAARPVQERSCCWQSCRSTGEDSTPFTPSKAQDPLTVCHVSY